MNAAQDYAVRGFLTLCERLRALDDEDNDTP